MKIKTALLTILFAELLLLSGCATNTSPTTGQTVSVTFLGITIYPTNAYSVALGGAYDAATYGIHQDTNVTAYLQSAYEILNDALGSTNFDPGELQTSLNEIDVSAIQNPLALSLITGVFTAASGIFIGLDADTAQASPFLLPIFEGIRDGIGKALGFPPSAKHELPNRAPRSAWVFGLPLLALRRKHGGMVAASALSLMHLTGCSLAFVYPKTTITGTLDGRPFKIQAPKNYNITGLEASVTANGEVHLKIDSLVSVLPASNITAVANGQAEIVTATGAVAHQAVQDALAAAAAAAK